MGMNWESEREMAKDVEENRDLYEALTDADAEGEDDAPLGTFLYEEPPGAEIDSVEAVRELREQE